MCLCKMGSQSKTLGSSEESGNGVSPAWRYSQWITHIINVIINKSKPAAPTETFLGTTIWKCACSSYTGFEQRRQRFSPCREWQSGDIRDLQSTPKIGRKGSDCDGERGYCSDSECENSSNPKSGAVYALLEGVQPLIHLRLQYRGSLERKESMLKSEKTNPIITVIPPANTTTPTATSGRKRLSESDPIELAEDGESCSNFTRPCEDKMKFESRQLAKVEEQSVK